ncbi:MAG: cytochrome P450 [Mycobacterium sp.]
MTDTIIDDTINTHGAPFFPAPRTCPFDAPAAYTDFREEGGLHKVTIWDGSEHWLATRHADIKEVLGSPAFSADVRIAGFPEVHAGMAREQGGLFLRLDDPEHNRLRRMLTKEFSVKATAAMRDKLTEITDELIDAILASDKPVDIVQDFALPLPSRAICDILGVPYEDREMFQAHANAGTDLSRDHSKPNEHEESSSEYYQRLVDLKRRQPGDDMISRLIRDHSGPDGFAPEVLPAVAGLLVGAGHETTANMLSLGILALLLNKSERERLRTRPELATTAAEEMLRYWSIVSTDPRRVALEDTEIGGQIIRKGEGIIVALIAGNRDPRAFGDTADSLDIGRNARQHVAFGFGTHQCLGQNLARVEMQVAFPRLFERIPDLRLAIPVEDVAYRKNSIVYGLTSLPVTWGEDA